MKTIIFYTVTFLAFSLANSYMAMSKFIPSVNCCSIDSVARFINRKVLILDLKTILDQFQFRKTPLPGGNINGNREENPQHYSYIWNRVPKVVLLNKLQKFKGAFFSTVNCSLHRQYSITVM